jgi:hypothetical protein
MLVSLRARAAHRVPAAPLTPRTDTINERSDERLARGRCSDSGDDLDPSLVHRPEPPSLLLGILVRDCADGVVAPAVLVDLARVSLVALINWTYLSQEVDLGNANDHGKSALRSA